MSEQWFKPSDKLTFDTIQPDSIRLFRILKQADISVLRLDLQNVMQCDSAGLALLVEAQRLCKQYKKRLIIEGVSTNMRALAEFCGVQSILETSN